MSSIRLFPFSLDYLTGALDTPLVFACTRQFFIALPTQQQLGRLAPSPQVASMYAVYSFGSPC